MTETKYNCSKCTYKAVGVLGEYCRAIVIDKKNEPHIEKSYCKMVNG